MSDKILSAHSGIVEFSTTQFLLQLRFVRRPVVEDGDIKMQMVLQQAMQDIKTGDVTWVDVPIYNE